MLLDIITLVITMLEIFKDVHCYSISKPACFQGCQFEFYALSPPGGWRYTEQKPAEVCCCNPARKGPIRSLTGSESLFSLLEGCGTIYCGNRTLAEVVVV